MVEETGDHPRSKRRWAALQGHLSVRVLKLTQGRQVHLVAEHEITDVLHELGLSVARHDLGSRCLHPHVAWVATRDQPADDAPGHDGLPAETRQPSLR